jgi:integrase/recombinase XerD
MVRQGKGQKDRLIPIGARALAWIECYRMEARMELLRGREEGILFLTAQGEILAATRMSQIVRHWIKVADIGKTGSCHLFRHTMATQMLEHGADIRYIQEILGHSDISTTEIYTRVSIQKLIAIHTATHPGANLEKRQEEVPPLR